jgi:rRNA maturation endonuclease Nob1
MRERYCLGCKTIFDAQDEDDRLCKRCLREALQEIKQKLNEVTNGVY